MSKRVWTVVFVFVLALLPALSSGVANAAPLGQEETYTVQKDDSLWSIAEKYLGNGAAYLAIVGATNKKAVEDETFPYITDPALIQPGWKLAIPSEATAKEFIDTYILGKDLPTEITLVDTNSGANFQWYFQTLVVPQVEKDLGLKINYVVGKGSEQIEKMKAWEPGKGDVHVLFIKPADIANMVKQDIPLETLYPDKLDATPNLAKCRQDYLATAQGQEIQGKGALYWRSQYALIYDSAKVTNPPKSWKEFYERRAEWKGHIGLIRPDSKSSSGRAQPYGFLNAFLDLSKPMAELETTPEWADAWAKMADFYTYATLPLAAEPTNMFENFNAGDTWISIYAMDYSLWSRSQGTMPPTVKAAFLEEGITEGADGYLVVPGNIPEEYKPVAYRLINYLLDDTQQIQLITTMWQYTGTEIWNKIPKEVWDVIPPWSEMEKGRVRMTNKDLIQYITDKGPDLLVPK
jgi:putative spermidine/putrescine transport system substrate-binding protein